MLSVGVFYLPKKRTLAFGTVNHDLLIKTFSYYGTRVIASSFLESYLKNRFQCVQFKKDKLLTRFYVMHLMGQF